MKRIEFIGGSGVGKTTLFLEIIKLKRAKDCWMTVEEARQNLAKTVYPKRKLHKLFQLYLRINKIKILQPQMVNRILNSYKVDVIDSMQDRYSDVADLILEGLINSSINSVKKIALASYYKQLLFDEIILFDFFKIEGLVAFHDSIIHVSQAFNVEEKVKTIFENHRILKTSLIPVGIVYCYLDKVKCLERRKKRINEGKGSLGERTLKNKELKELNHRSLKVAEDKIKVLKNYNIEILELNMEDSVQDNAKKAYNFINKLSKK